MHPYSHSGLNIGELIRNGVALTTREVVGLLFEACQRAGTAFPQTPDDMWIASTGELLITQFDELATPKDPPSAVAGLLETMLPDGDGERAVSPALRGLPARLRDASGDGPQARQDLMSILSSHLGGDARQIVRQLADRITHRNVDALAARAVLAPATPGRQEVHDDFGLFEDEAEASGAPARVEPPPPAAPAARQPRHGLLLAILACAMFALVGSAAYWLRDWSGDQPIELAEAPPVAAAEQIEPPPPTVTDTAPAVTDVNRAAPAGADDPYAAEPLQLSVTGGAFSPAFARSGHELTFHVGHSQSGRLLVASLDDNGQATRVSALVDEGARNYHARLSPDGRWLAFDSDRDGERGVYVSERNGSTPQRVSGDGYGAVPSWSPDMKRLAFVRAEASRPRVWNLWLRDLSSGAVQRHTSFRSGQVWGASWFPDGRSLAYSHDDRLVISHLDAREDIAIDTPRPGHPVRTPAVSPDGRRVIFQVFKDGAWLLDVRTRQMQRVLDDPTAEEFSWAPNGRRVAYHSRRDGTWKIWVMTVPG